MLAGGGVDWQAWDRLIDFHADNGTDGVIVGGTTGESPTLGDAELRPLFVESLWQYEAKFGKDSRSTFGGHAWDAYLLLARAVPEAMKKGKPGTKEFRIALRDALENTKELVATHGVSVCSPSATSCGTTSACSFKPPSWHSR